MLSLPARRNEDAATAITSSWSVTVTVGQTGSSEASETAVGAGRGALSAPIETSRRALADSATGRR
jgi:hypothetical protein